MRNGKMMVAAGLALCLAMALVPMVASAATEAQKEAAISAGLAHLAATQLGDGRWDYGTDDEDCGATAAALLAFAEEGHTTTSATAYSAVVTKGLNYILNRGAFYGTNGIKFVPGGNNNRDTYVTGLVIPSIVANNTPNAVVAGGALVGMTHKQIVQDTLKYFEYGQSDSGWATGGWRYYANYGSSDNSTTQWPLLAMLYGTKWGLTPPNSATLQSKLDTWIGYIQNPGDGGSYYDNNFAGWGSNMSRTGALLLEMAYNGWPTGTPAEQAAYAKALAYINANWKTAANGWDGNFGHPYAMWGVYKGLELTIGLNNTTTITNLHAAGTMDPGDTWNWWEDFCEYLVNDQLGSGAWPDHSGYNYWTNPLSTAWAINILNATQVGGPVIPEPLTCGALMLGLGGLFGYIRRRRLAA